MGVVSIPATTIRRGNTTARYCRKACSIWNLWSVLSLPRTPDITFLQVIPGEIDPFVFNKIFFELSMTATTDAPE